MFRDKKRFGQDPEKVIRSKTTTFNAPLKWQEPARVFVCSWSDFFIQDGTDPWRGEAHDVSAWRSEAWEIMRQTPHLTYQILTKRPENIIGMLPDGWPFKNVWLGVTAENQEMANKRIPILLGIDASIRFVSVEPMIGPIDLGGNFMGRLGLDWIICGGETGPNNRWMKPEWALDLKRQCVETNTPFFMKQMSGKAPIPDYLQGQEFPRQ